MPSLGICSLLNCRCSHDASLMAPSETLVPKSSVFTGWGGGSGCPKGGATWGCQAGLGTARPQGEGGDLELQEQGGGEEGLGSPGTLKRNTGTSRSGWSPGTLEHQFPQGCSLLLGGQKASQVCLGCVSRSRTCLCPQNPADGVERVGTDVKRAP